LFTVTYCTHTHTHTQYPQNPLQCTVLAAGSIPGLPTTLHSRQGTEDVGVKNAGVDKVWKAVRIKQGQLYSDNVNTI